MLKVLVFKPTGDSDKVEVKPVVLKGYSKLVNRAQGMELVVKSTLYRGNEEAQARQALDKCLLNR